MLEEKVSELGDTVTSPVSLELISTITFDVGFLLERTTVTLSVVPDSLSDVDPLVSATVYDPNFGLVSITVSQEKGEAPTSHWWGGSKQLLIEMTFSRQKRARKKLNLFKVQLGD